MIRMQSLLRHDVSIIAICCCLTIVAGCGRGRGNRDALERDWLSTYDDDARDRRLDSSTIAKDDHPDDTANGREQFASRETTDDDERGFIRNLIDGDRNRRSFPDDPFLANANTDGTDASAEGIKQVAQPEDEQESEELASFDFNLDDERMNDQPAENTSESNPFEFAETQQNNPFETAAVSDSREISRNDFEPRIEEREPVDRRSKSDDQLHDAFAEIMRELDDDGMESEQVAGQEQDNDDFRFNFDDSARDERQQETLRDSFAEFEQATDSRNETASEGNASDWDHFFDKQAAVDSRPETFEDRGNIGDFSDFESGTPDRVDDDARSMFERAAEFSEFANDDGDSEFDAVPILADTDENTFLESDSESDQGRDDFTSDNPFAADSFVPERPRREEEVERFVTTDTNPFEEFGSAASDEQASRVSANRSLTLPPPDDIDDGSVPSFEPSPSEAPEFADALRVPDQVDNGHPPAPPAFGPVDQEDAFTAAPAPVQAESGGQTVARTAFDDVDWDFEPAAQPAVPTRWQLPWHMWFVIVLGLFVILRLLSPATPQEAKQR